MDGPMPSVELETMGEAFLLRMRPASRFMRRIFHDHLGLSMVELMMALALTGILGLSVHAAFVSQVRSYSVQDQFHVMEQNAKTALDVLARELRMAGFSMAYVNGSTYMNDFAFAVGTSVILPDGSTIQTNNDTARAGSDALVLRRGTMIPLTIDFWQPQQKLFKTQIDFPVSEGDFFFLLTPDRTEFRSVKVDKVVITEDQGQGEPPDIIWMEEGYTGEIHSPNGLTADYTGGLAIKMNTMAFYLDSNTTRLMQRIDDKTPQVLADNVEDFQVAYQLSDGSWVVDGNVADTGAIRAVRVNILVRSPFEDTDNPIFSHVGVEDGARHPADGTDGFRRVAFSTTIKVRNMGLEL